MQAGPQSWDVGRVHDCSPTSATTGAAFDRKMIKLAGQEALIVLALRPKLSKQWSLKGDRWLHAGGLDTASTFNLLVERGTRSHSVHRFQTIDEAYRDFSNNHLRAKFDQHSKATPKATMIAEDMELGSTVLKLFRTINNNIYIARSTRSILSASCGCPCCSTKTLTSFGAQVAGSFYNIIAFQDHGVTSFAAAVSTSLPGRTRPIADGGMSKTSHS
ncbi:hypothetical protein CF327_g2537 [Tilletia walkeri]|nr:hypothetical protein CF327_g2537 [Tilletia walkeri]